MTIQEAADIAYLAKGQPKPTLLDADDILERADRHYEQATNGSFARIQSRQVRSAVRAIVEAINDLNKH